MTEFPDIDWQALVPNPNWGRETRAMDAIWFAEREAQGLLLANAPNGRPPIKYLWAFAKAARNQPDIWEDCVVEAERRKHEVLDPNSELRLSEQVREDTPPEYFICEWFRFCDFAKWFLYKIDRHKIDSSSYYSTIRPVLRMWCRGDMDENDYQAFVIWFENNMPRVAVMDGE